MAKLQFVTSHAQGPYAACEALWQSCAQAALRNGHNVNILLSKISAAHPAVRQLSTGGASVRLRRGLGNGTRLGSVAQRIFERTIERVLLPRLLVRDADVQVLNVGTMVEVVRDPWVTWLSSTRVPYAVIVHSNSEIRTYPDRVIRQLQMVLTQASRIYFVSDRLRLNAEELIVSSLSNVRIVRNPVNLSGRHIEPWPEDQPLRMAVVGRLDSFVKGQVRLLHALSSEAWKRRDWFLTIFGTGPDCARIEEAVGFYGLSDRVAFGGFVDDIRTNVWKEHHLLIMPSMIEGMPLALVEAMLCGRPAVASDVGGAAELIRDGENGFISGSPFASQISKALERVWARRDQLKEMGLQAHADALAFLPEDPGAVLLNDIIQLANNR